MMNTGKKILFIINPVSGKKSGKPDAGMITNFFSGSGMETQTVFTTHGGHGSELAAGAVKNGFTAVIAIGGDGTVNEIARSLYKTPCALGIIPCGSGNGLARHHKISLDVKKALGIIRNYKVVNHDAVSINNELSFNVSGIGFDAHVAHLFGRDGNRGFKNYLKLVMSEFSSYKPFSVSIESDSGIRQCEMTMLVSVANASQFGNNARISPHSDTNDGIADIISVSRMQGWKMPCFALKVFNGQVATSRYATVLKGKNCVIRSNHELPLHIDGEPAGFAKEFKIETHQSALSLIVP